MNKIQTNEQGNNIVVQTDNSDSMHYYHGNFEVDILEVLTEDKILELFRANTNRKQELENAKSWMMSQPGYASSNVSDKTLNLNYNDIIAYKIV